MAQLQDFIMLVSAREYRRNSGSLRKILEGKNIRLMGLHNGRRSGKSKQMVILKGRLKTRPCTVFGEVIEPEPREYRLLEIGLNLTNYYGHPFSKHKRIKDEDFILDEPGLYTVVVK